MLGFLAGARDFAQHGCLGMHCPQCLFYIDTSDNFAMAHITYAHHLIFDRNTGQICSPKLPNVSETVWPSSPYLHEHKNYIN